MTAIHDVAHLNTAGSGLNSEAVLAAVTGCLEVEGRYGAYEAELRLAEVLGRDVYHAVGALLGCPVEDVALFDNATRAWVTAVHAVAFRPGGRVWITPYEYAGNILALQEPVRRFGLRIEVIPTDPLGDVDLAWMERNLDDDVALVSMVHVPSNCGIVNPVAEVGRLLARAADPPLYVVDACQSVGLLPIDVAEIGCDVLTGAGRKFVCGPRGTAFAYLSRRFRDRASPATLDLHVADVRALDRIELRRHGAATFELAERSNAAVAGLNVAVRERLACRRDASALRAELRSVLGQIDGVRLIDPGRRQAGILSFVHDRLQARAIVEGLRRAGVNTWVADGKHTPIHMGAIGVDFAVRCSVHVDNRPDDIRRFEAALVDLIESSRAPAADRGALAGKGAAR